MQFNDLTNQTFGRLKPQWPVGIRGIHNLWLCFCECGNFKAIEISKLTSGNTTSCGCYRIEAGRSIGLTNLRHGQARQSKESPEYRSWKSMLQRCTNPKAPDYSHYGGKGVSVCDRWRNSFEDFFSDMGSRPVRTSLGRFGDEGDYEPGNCAWQTPIQQAANRRRKVA